MPYIKNKKYIMEIILQNAVSIVPKVTFIQKCQNSILNRMGRFIVLSAIMFCLLYMATFVHAENIRQVKVRKLHTDVSIFPIGMYPVGLRCEYQVNPIGIDTARPRLSWESKINGQQAFQIEVSEMKPTHVERARSGIAKSVWQSEWIESSDSLNWEYNGPELRSGTVYTWRVRNKDSKGKVSQWSTTEFWVTGILNKNDWKASWFSTELYDAKKGEQPFLTPDDSPWTRTRFNLDNLPEQALTFVNVLGYYELYVNGNKVSRDVLSPAVTAYKKRSVYKVYDILPYLKKGSNTIGLHLSRGWYTAPDYGAVRKSALARIQTEFRFSDGRAEFLADVNKWECRPSDRTRLGKWTWNLMGGERLDSRKKKLNWSNPAEFNEKVVFPSEGWRPVKPIDSPNIAAEFDRTPPIRVVQNVLPKSLKNQFVNTLAEVKKVAVDDGKSETWLIDFGTNLTGWAEIQFEGFDRDCEIRMDYADRLEPWQSMNQYDIFVTSGSAIDRFTSKFNYHGFRYVYVTWPKSQSVKGKIRGSIANAIGHDFETMGNFLCSDPLIMKIHKVNLWTLRSLSLGGFMSDCPHRERIGYGDGQLSIESCIMNFNMAQFYEKWGRDWTDCTEPDGYVYHNAPQNYKSGGGPAWGGTASALAWCGLLYYNNRKMTEEMYKTAEGHIRALDQRAGNEVLRAFGGKWDFLGDWVPVGRGMDTDNWPSPKAAEQFNNCYRIYLKIIQAKMAAALGKYDKIDPINIDVDRLRPLIHQAYFDQKNRMYVVDEQAYYVMALMTGVVPDNLRAEIDEKLVKNILVKNNGHLDTGMLGTYFLINYLMERGRNDLVWKIVSQKSYPGWGYMLEKGATTWWEQWNGYYSQIHSCFCSLDSWFYQGIVGIRPDENETGFRKFKIEPFFPDDLTWAQAEYKSFYGNIFCRWEKSDSRLSMLINVPCNTSAKLVVPINGNEDLVECDCKDLPNDVKFIEKKDNKLIFNVQPGKFQFSF